MTASPVTAPAGTPATARSPAVIGGAREAARLSRCTVDETTSVSRRKRECVRMVLLFTRHCAYGVAVLNFLGAVRYRRRSPRKCRSRCTGRQRSSAAAGLAGMHPERNCAASDPQPRRRVQTGGQCRLCRTPSPAWHDPETSGPGAPPFPPAPCFAELHHCLGRNLCNHRLDLRLELFRRVEQSDDLSVFG